MIKSRIGDQAILEFVPFAEIETKENTTTTNNQSTSLKKDTDNKSNNLKNFYWITTKNAENSDQNI